jgi:FimV-like protein
MITLILKNYFTIILSITVMAVSIITVGSYCLVRRFFAKSTAPIAATNNNKKETVVNSEPFSDFTTIAGDDLISTQLDLARAYIETDKRQLAKTILDLVIKQGTKAQKDEAQELLSFL